MKRASALLLATLALAPASLAHASPLIIDQQRVDQTAPQPPDALRGRTEDSGRAPLENNTPQVPVIRDGAATTLTTVEIVGSSLAASDLASAYNAHIGTRLDDATIAAICDARRSKLHICRLGYLPFYKGRKRTCSLTAA